MKATAMILALGATLAFAGVARADQIETVDQNGIRWRWIEATTCTEERSVTIPAHYETRCELVTEPGHYETRERQVWVPGTTTYERRERFVPLQRTVCCGSIHQEPAHCVIDVVPVTHGGYWKSVCESVWIPGCTHRVERQVWVEERVEMRCVTVTRPGHWERVCCERERDGLRIDVDLGAIFGR